jgi:hypothetical protein
MKRFSRDQMIFALIVGAVILGITLYRYLTMFWLSNQWNDGKVEERNIATFHYPIALDGGRAVFGPAFIFGSILT